MMRFCLGIAALALMSCGETEENDLGTQVAGLVLGQDETPVASSPVITEEQLLASSGQYIRVNIRELESWDTMAQAGENGSRSTWINSASISVTLENGIVVATRGLPRDLMGADVAGTWNAIRSGGGSARRQHDFLSDQDQTETIVLQCSIESKGNDQVNRLGQSLSATRFEESCSSDGLGLTNIYWVNRGGSVIRSLQAVSPEAGYLQIDVF